MKRKSLLQLLLVASLLVLGLLMATLASGAEPTTKPAQSQAVAFQDTYSRDDGAPPEDSLGTTEAGPGLAVLDYRELGGCCGTPGVADIAEIEGGSLVVHGRGTDPAWVELDDAGRDFDFEVEAEFLATDVDGSAVANSVSFLIRNAGASGDGTIFSPGAVSFEMLLDGTFGVRGFVTDMDDNISLAQGIVDAAAFATADLDGDGRLEMGEPFTLRLILEGDSFSFDFNGSRQISNTDLSVLPEPPAAADRLLFGRNRWRFASTEVEIQFDNLRSLTGSTATATITPSMTTTPTVSLTPTSSLIPTVTPTATPERSTGPHLDIPSDIPATADQPVSIPINFSSNGHDIASTTFSIDYDQVCLAFDPTDSDGDDVPDAIVFGVPEAFGTTVAFDESDPDGELDFFIADTLPPLASLPDGTIATMSLTPTCQASPNTTTIAAVNFATDPPASFGNTEGHSVPGTTSNGSVLIQSSLPGDCNADHAVDAGDIPALALEIFDGDGANPADTQGGTFAGDPVGCNANQDALVDAGDITCLGLLIFNGPGACGSGDRECIAPPSGLVGWWPGDSDANDISGNSNHAQLANGALAGTPGKVGGAFEFDGVDDVADTDLTLPAQGTLELWVNPTSLSHDHGIIGTFGKANGDDRLWLKVTGPEGGIGGPNRLRVNLGSCCAADIDISSPLALETWTQLALTFDYILDDYVLYVNGQIAGTTTVSRDAPTGKLSFGGLNSTWGESLFFGGLVDEVTLYDRVLTTNEIEAVFNAGSAGKCKDNTHSLISAGSSRTLLSSGAQPDGPMLAVPDLMSPPASRHASVPVDFTSNGHSIAAIAFSVDYDESLLAFDPTDDDQDNLPDTITLNLPSAFDASVNFDESDSIGELDFLIADTLPPLASLPDGTVATVSLNVVRSPTSTTSAKVSFSDNPVASFGNTSGQSVPGTTRDGSVLIRCPDCVLFLPMMLTSGTNER